MIFLFMDISADFCMQYTTVPLRNSQCGVNHPIPFVSLLRTPALNRKEVLFMQYMHLQTPRSYISYNLSTCMGRCVSPSYPGLKFSRPN